MFKLSSFSLQKQIGILFGTVLILTVLVLIPTINHNLNEIIDNEMYQILNEAQVSFHDYNISSKTDSTERQIYHMYYDSKNDIGFPSITMTSKDISSMRNVFKERLSLMLKQNENTARSKGIYKNETMYYQISKTGENHYLISLIYSDYSKDLVSALEGQIIYTFYIAMFMMGATLFFWVTTLVKPLQLIKGYIDNVKASKEAKLSIHRNDEIGIVSRSLVEMTQELEYQAQSKKEMMHNISHDLKTPIALIKNYSQSIKDGVYPYGDRDQSLDVIIDNAQRLEDKVISLLYLNRLEYSKDQVVTTSFDMKDVLEAVVNQIKIIYPDIKVETEYQSCAFIGDQEHWRICIENILENAYRYVKSKIVVKLEPGRLEIYNDGPSIDEGFMKSIFEPYQVGNKGQFGLGLSIVAKTVELYHYQVSVENHEVGVSFTIKQN